MYLSHIISADEEYPRACRRNPFSVTTVYGNMTDVNTIQQVVSIITSIIAWYLYLIEYSIFMSYFVFIQIEESYVCANPNVSLFILTGTIDVHNIVFCTILIDEAIVFDDFISRRLIETDERI